jgi:DNA-binding transcriptional LysR family regulator
MDQLRAIRYFIAVAEGESFSTAAKQFDVPASSISRRISDLESSLGAQLLKRTTRMVHLTEIGEAYYRQVKDIVGQLEQSDQTVRSYQTKPTGRLKISSMVGFGERILIPLMDEFSERYPDILLDVVLSDELSSLSRDDVDIAIRGGYAPNERVLAVKLMENQFIPVAAPAYIKTYGVPKTTEQLKQHRGLFFKTPAGPIPWLSEIHGQWQQVAPPAAMITNNGKWLVDQAIAGKGILMMPYWVLKPYLESGELIQLKFDQPLDITQSANLAVYMLYQKSSYGIPKIKAAVDFIAARVKDRYHV